MLLRDVGFLESFERIGIQTIGTLLPVAVVLMMMMMAGGLHLEALRNAWALVYRSYSRKLLLVYGTMLLVPLLAVTLALLGVLGDRLERTREIAGHSAMEASPGRHRSP